jgi:hypothetical protein
MRHSSQSGAKPQESHCFTLISVFGIKNEILEFQVIKIARHNA